MLLCRRTAILRNKLGLFALRVKLFGLSEPLFTLRLELFALREHIQRLLLRQNQIDIEFGSVWSAALNDEVLFLVGGK